MAMSRKSPVNRSDELMDKLLATIGKGNADNLERYTLVQDLRKIEAACLVRSKTGPFHKLLQSYRANTARRRELRRRLRPIHDDIEMAGLLRANPGVDEGDLRAALQDNTKNFDLAEIEANEDQDITFLIKRAGDYRKRQVRKQVVEPFFWFLEKHGVVPSRKLPRTHDASAVRLAGH
jgi:hypothetical protein